MASVPSHWSLDIFAAEPMLSQSLTRGNRRAAAKQLVQAAVAEAMAPLMLC